MRGALLLVRLVRRKERQAQLLLLCQELSSARVSLARARSLLDRQQFGECLNVLATLQEKNGPVAMRQIAQEAKLLRDEVVAALRQGEGYLGSVVSDESWDEERFAGYMAALSGAGKEFATSASRIELVHRTLLRNCDRNIGGGLEIKTDKMKVFQEEKQKKRFFFSYCLFQIGTLQWS